MPSLNSADFTCTFPSASNELPLRAAFLDAMEEKLTIPEVRDEWIRWFSSTMLLSTRRAMHTELRVNHRGSSSSGYKHQQAQAKHYQTVSCKKFQDLESQVLNSAVICQDLGTLSCKHVTFQNLACQVLKELCKISDLWQPSLGKYVHLCSCLGRPSHEIHKSLSYC